MVEIAHFEDLKKELLVLQNYRPVHKDIIIVVRDQLEYVKQCIESIRENTEDFSLFIWDNGSSKQTTSYLKSLNVEYRRSENNLGFIIPNNRMVGMGESPYVILLNSDTIVHKDWDKAMIAWLQAHSQIALVGYQGCYLNEEAQGEWQGFGYEIDYVSGWSMAIPRSIIQDFGLFDETNLQFAYGEDSDLCLRLKEEGYQVYAMHLELAEHFGNRTVKQLVNEGFDLHTSFRRNHEYLKNRWLCKK